MEPDERIQSLAALAVKAFLFVINVRLRIALVHRASISNHLQNLAGYWKVSVQQRHIAAQIGLAHNGMSDINYARSYLKKGAKNAQNVREVANISPVWYFNQITLQHLRAKSIRNWPAEESQCQNAETQNTASSYCTLMLTRRMQNG